MLRLIDALHQKHTKRSLRPFARQERRNRRQLRDALLRFQLLQAFERLELRRRSEGFPEASHRVAVVIANDTAHEPPEVLAVEAVHVETVREVVFFQVRHGCAGPEVNRQALRDVCDGTPLRIEQRKLVTGPRRNGSNNNSEHREQNCDCATAHHRPSSPSLSWYIGWLKKGSLVTAARVSQKARSSCG